jgi:hypothetical protein
MQEKAAAAYTLVSPHLPTPVDRRSRAVYQREIVRRYNGGHEFRYDGGWVIDPGAGFMWEDAADHAKGPKRALQYPNRVLGTGVVYYRSAAGVANAADAQNTAFSWPIAFTAADFGPET